MDEENEDLLAAATIDQPAKAAEPEPTPEPKPPVVGIPIIQICDANGRMPLEVETKLIRNRIPRCLMKEENPGIKHIADFGYGNTLKELERAFIHFQESSSLNAQKQARPSTTRRRNGYIPFAHMFCGACVTPILRFQGDDGIDLVLAYCNSYNATTNSNRMINWITPARELLINELYPDEFGNISQLVMDASDLHLLTAKTLGQAGVCLYPMWHDDNYLWDCDENGLGRRGTSFFDHGFPRDDKPWKARICNDHTDLKQLLTHPRIYKAII